MPLKTSTNQVQCPARSAILGVLATLILLCGVACPGAAPTGGGGGGGNTPPVSGAVSFADDIQPLLNDRCTVCHQPGGFATSNVIPIPMDLREASAYEAIFNKPSVQNSDLTLVVPGDAENSLLYQKISSNPPPVGARMPLSADSLSQAEINLIERWINEGAQEN